MPSTHFKLREDAYFEHGTTSARRDNCCSSYPVSSFTSKTTLNGMLCEIDGDNVSDWGVWPMFGEPIVPSGWKTGFLGMLVITGGDFWTSSFSFPRPQWGLITTKITKLAPTYQLWQEFSCPVARSRYLRARCLQPKVPSSAVNNGDSWSPFIDLSSSR